MTFPLQHLIVTQGWRVNYHRFFAVDPTPELVADNEWLWFKEDLYQARHERNDRLIDLGWYPEGNFDKGRYKLVLYAGDFRGELLQEVSTKERAVIVETMNDWFAAFGLI